MNIEKKLNLIETRLDKLTKLVNKLTFEGNQIIDKREAVLKYIISLTKNYISKQVFDEYGGDGFDTREEIKYRFNDLIYKTGFVSIQIENNKAFLYTLNPMYFIKDDKMWNFITNRVKEKYNLKFLAIGRYSFKENDTYGLYINSFIN